LLQGLAWRHYIALRSRLASRFGQISNDPPEAYDSLPH